MKNKLFFGTFLVTLTACTFFYFNKIKKPQPSLTAYEQYLADHFYNKAADNITIEMPGETETEAAKTDRPDLAFEQDFRITMDPVLKRPATERLIFAREMIAMQQRNKQTLMAPIWEERGPKNVGGRTRTVVYDPNDLSNKKVWAGGVGGGLWYCNDITAASPIWNRVNDFWENIAISSIAFDPTNTQLMYVGTGEGWSNLDAQRGAGVWKSSNGGLGFERLLSTNNTTFYHTQKIVVNATGVYVGTKAGGVMRSTDGGTSFTKVLGSTVPIGASNPISDLEIGADGTIYAGIGIFTSGSVWKSTSGNANTWTKLNNGTNGFPTSGFERVEIAVAPNDSNVLYAITQDASTNGLYNIYYSANKGTSWTTCAKPADADGGIPSADFTRTQAWYDLTAAVDPNNASTVIVGGVDLFKSTNAGTSWTQISHWYGGFSFPDVHADQHVITFKKNSSSEVLFGNDGGIYLSANINNASPTFSNKNNGYNVTQFYSCAMSPTAASNIFLAGSQDNGTQRFSAAGLNNTTRAYGGDGAFCFFDQDNPTVAIASYVYNNYYRSTNSGTSFNTTLSSSSTTGSFINPADYDNRENILYSAYSTSAIQKITNVTTTPATSQITINTLGAMASHLSVSPYAAIGTSTVFVGTEAGKVFKITNAQSAIPTTIQLGTTLGGSISCIEIGASENELLVTLSNYGIISVYYSDNGGNTFTSKEGNLPDMPVRWALFNPQNRNEVLLATELGVWYTASLNLTTPNWVASNAGLATTRVDMLQYRSSDNLVIAATHGRGLFSCSNFTLNITQAPTSNFTANKLVVCKGDNVTFTDQSSDSPNAWSWSFNGGTPSTSSLANPTIKYDSLGTFAVTLTASNIIGTSSPITKTAFITVVNKPALPIITGYTSTCLSDTNVYMTLIKSDQYTWTITGGNIISGQNTDSLVVVWTSIGNKNIGLKLTNNSGCESAIKNTAIKVFDKPNLSTINGLAEYCQNDTAIYSVTTNASYILWEINGGEIIGRDDSEIVKVVWKKYAFNNDISINASNGAGCRLLSNKLNVITNVLPKASFTSNIDTVMINKGGMIKFTNTSTDASTLTWDFGDSSQTSSMEHPTHQYIKPGTYTVTLIASNGNCIQQFQKTIVVIMGTGFSQNFAQQITVSPNPSSDIINIKYGKNHLRNIILFDATGKAILNSNENKIVIKEIPNGNYILRIFFEEGVVDKKIIKKN
jgi:PKD repeat protein